MSNLLSLKDFIEIDTLQKIQDEFAIASNFAIIAVDYKGKPLTKHSKCSEFCNLVRNNPTLKKVCEQSDAHGGLEAARKETPHIYRCHLGLIDFAAPIIFEGQYLGSILGGQVLLDENESQEIDNIIKESMDFKDNKKLLEAYSKIPVVPLEKVKAASETLFLFCNYLVEKAMINIIQQELHDKDIKLIENSKNQVELEKLLKETEFKALQSQINPHFLFNALNTIGRLALLEKAPKTQDLIYMLSSMLRYSLKQGHKKVHLNKAIDHVENYLAFQQIRFGDRVKFEISISEDIKSVKIPFMTIQPIVENAILHGIEPKEDGGLVKINGHKYKEDIIIEISDTGVGISKDKLYSIKNNLDKISLGINNVNKRLIHYYGEDYSIDIDSIIDQGTKVTIKIPIE